ncbi:MAG: hypothetical protein IJX55_00955, partial [Clostridia bacterium]|nr:hypothetical protein [Clostridia bacterium]
MKKKLTVLFLTIIFILCLGTVFVSATNASDETPTLSIAGFSLSLKESIFINCKVSHNNLDAEYVDDIQILVWEEVPEAYTANNNPSAVLSWLGTDNSGYESYRYTNITAKEMTKELYFCAYVKTGDTEIYSAPKK